MLTAAALAIPALNAPSAAADIVTLRCTTEIGTPTVVECIVETPVTLSDIRCETLGAVTSVGGVITVPFASCFGTGYSPVSSGTGQFTGNTVIINSATGLVTILSGSGTLVGYQPQTGITVTADCAGAVLALTAVPLVLDALIGGCTITVT
jgi:hypothetical protein